MSLNTQLGDTSANAACTAIAARANGGTMKIYAGSQPANGNTAISSQTLLATINLPNPAFATAAAGVAALNATSPATAVATGTASFFRIFDSSGNQVIDGTIGTSGCNINMGSTSIASGAQVAITSYQFSIAEAGS